MPNDQIKGSIGSLIFSFQAGTLGGILAGIFEVLLISGFGASPANLSGLLFAMIAYGILGGVVGLALNIAFHILPFHRDRRSSRRHLGAALLAGSLCLVLFFIFLFRAFRDFHAERVRYLEPTGLATIAVLLAAAVLLFILVRLILDRPLKDLLVWFLRPVGYLLVIAALLIVGFVFQSALSKETEEAHAAFSPVGQDQVQDKPCVILIMVDTLRPDWLGCYGGTVASTPNMDALAGDAVLYHRTYAQATHTKPSTASLLTSRYPTEHRAIHKTEALPLVVTTLAEVLGQAGYYCGGIVDNVNLAPIYNFQQGFHEYVYLPPKFFFGANEAASRLVIYGVLRLVRMKLVKSTVVHHFYRSGETVTGYFDDFIERNKNRKFFLFLHYMDPHDPYFEHPYSGKGYARAAMPNPDPRFAGPFREFYRQDVEYLDSWIGRVMEKLKTEGLYDASVIVLTADHGEEFYEHGGWWHGTTLHEEQVRIPLLFKRLGNLDSGMIVESLTRSIDVAPTILAEMKVDPPAEMRGRNLFDNPAPENFEPEIFSEADHEGNVVRMLRIGPWKYIETNPDNPRQQPPRQLFYLPDDPGELNNLIDIQLAKADDMQLLLQAKYQEIAATAEEGAEQIMDEATKERLRALGYTQ